MSFLPFSSRTKIIYNPDRPKYSNHNLCIGIVDPEITRLYRYMVKKRFWIDLDEPQWGSHITIVKREKFQAKYKKEWKKFQGKQIIFHYSNDIQTFLDKKNGGVFWSILVKSKGLDEIRASIGLPSTGLYHITIGRQNVVNK